MGVLTKAIVDRAQGRPASRTRSALAAAAAGVAAAGLVYKFLRQPASAGADDDGD